MSAEGTLTPEERSLHARIAINTRWANTSESERSDLGHKRQQALLRKFERQVDPDGLLDPAERSKRAENLRNAHMARLSLKASQARRKKAATKGGAA